MSKMIDTIRDGMAKAHDDPAMICLGDMLTDWVHANPNAGETEAGDRTLDGAMSAIREEARKHQGKGVGVVSDADALKIALKYYGIDTTKRKPVSTLDIDALLGS
jgi:hypothetical protein